MKTCFFVSDLHGSMSRYRKLFDRIEAERPSAVFLGGDLLPSGVAMMARGAETPRDFINDVLAIETDRIRERLGAEAPRFLLILGNDDLRSEEASLLEGAARGIWSYIHGRCVDLFGYRICGYANIPPTPFRLKDWERYDVSRYVDPGFISPENGVRTVAVPEHEARYATIASDLDRLAGRGSLKRTVMLFHAPPYKTGLDRAALDGKSIDYAPLDVHVGSIAIRRFIEKRQPLLTLHGHVHESARITGLWHDRIGHTHCLSAAHDGPELALVRFDLENPADARRELL